MSERRYDAVAVVDFRARKGFFSYIILLHFGTSVGAKGGIESR